MTTLPADLKTVMHNAFSEFAQKCCDDDFEAWPAFEAGFDACFTLMMGRVGPLAAFVSDLAKGDSSGSCGDCNANEEVAREIMKQFREFTGGGK